VSLPLPLLVRNRQCLNVVSPVFDQHAPGVPKVLIGNRLHLEFKRQVSVTDAEEYAIKHKMGFFEVSSLCNFNISESFVELSRMALQRNGMERLWRSNKGEKSNHNPANQLVSNTVCEGSMAHH